MPTVIEFVYTHSILQNGSINTIIKVRDFFVHHGRTAILLFDDTHLFFEYPDLQLNS